MIGPRLHSLRGRLLAAMLAVFALGLAASLASYRFEIHNLVSNLHERTLQTQARALLAATHMDANGRVQVRLPADWRHVYAAHSGQFSYTIFDASRRPLAWSPNLHAPLHYLAAPVHTGLGPVEFLGIGADRQTVLAARNARGLTLLVARTGISRDTLVDSLFAENSEHLLVLLPFALLALGLIWLITNWSLKPIARASREAALVGPGKPDLRIRCEDMPREIQPLVEAVNGALERLSRAYATERQLTADAAHELRTPLAALNLRLQRARLTGAADWPALERELAQMGRLVDQLLDLARKESLTHQSRISDKPVVNLSRLVREAAAMLVPLAEVRGRALRIEVPDVLPLRGSADDLRDLIRNLIENGLVHGCGAVTVRVRPAGSAPDARASSVLLEVSDEGTGVPPGQEERVFERFRKLNQDAPGSGLGLAIVRQVARSHGGEVRFEPGRGCLIVSLPAMSPAPRAMAIGQ